MSKWHQLDKIFNKTEKAQIFIYLLLSIINPLIEVIGLGSILALILFFFDNIDSNFNLFIQKFNIENIKLSEQFTIHEILYFIILIFLLKAIYMVFFSYFETKMRNNLMANKSKHAFENFINKPYLQVISTTKSEVFNSSVLEAARIVDFIIGIAMMLREIILLTILFFSLLLINTIYTSFLFTTLILFFVLIYFIFNKKMYIIGEELRILQRSLVDQVNEAFSSIKVIDILNKKYFFSKKFNLTTEIRKRNLFLQQYIKKLPRIIFEAYLVIAICSTILIFYSEENFSQIISYIAVLGLISSRVLPSFTNLNVTYSTMKFNEASIDNFFLKFYSDKNTTYKKKEINNKFDQVNSIKIFDLNFSYEGKKKIIHSLNIEVIKGEILGVFGRSGSGKSTFTDILCGLIIPQKGKIIINNEININDFLYNWKSSVGYVPQSPLLLNDSITNNICLGVEQNKINIQKLNEVIDKTGLRSLINENKNLNNLMVGESGQKLSGGQKQRISIARTLYFNPKVLIFDEATSSLDFQSENEILNLILKLKKEHIIIFITHNEKIKKLCSKSIDIEEYNEK